MKPFMAVRVSLKDVARACGLGISTVSQALRDEGTTSAATRARVKAVAERLGYRPNPLLAALASRRFRDERVLRGTPMVYLTHLPTHRRSPNHLIHWPGAERAARELGYDLRRVELAEVEDGAVLGRRLMDQGVAVVIAGLFEFDRRPPLKGFPWAEFVGVVCGYNPWVTGLHRIGPEIGGSVRHAWERAWAAGYRRIGAALCSHEPQIPDDRERLGAVLECECRHGVAGVVPPHLGPMPGGDPFVGWYREHRPDAVIGFHEGLLHDLRGAGVRVPGEVGFVDLHRSEGMEAAAGVTGVVSREGEVGAEAVRLSDLLLRQRRAGGTPGLSRLVVDFAWAPGTTLPGKVAGAPGGGSFAEVQPV